MSRGTLMWVAGAALVVLLTLVFIPGVVMAKKPVKPPPEPEPDPDPAIAYRAWTGETWVLKVMNADGSNETTVVDDGIDLRSESDWSPGGTELVFGGTSDGVSGIYVVDLDDSELTLVATTPSLDPPVWSPSEVPGVGGDVERIAYTDIVYGATWRFDLFLVDPDGVEDTVQLSDGPNNARCPTWSPDSTKLALPQETTQGTYCILDFNGEGGSYTFTSHQLTGTLAECVITDMSWSKTQEDKITFAAITESDGWDIYVLDLDTPTKATRLTSLKYRERHSSWSPDDEKIVFELLPRKNADPDIAVMNPDGTGITTILKGGMCPTWKR